MEFREVGKITGVILTSYSHGGGPDFFSQNGFVPWRTLNRGTWEDEEFRSDFWRKKPLCWCGRKLVFEGKNGDEWSYFQASSSSSIANYSDRFPPVGKTPNGASETWATRTARLLLPSNSVKISMVDMNFLGAKMVETCFLGLGVCFWVRFPIEKQ